MTWTRRHADMAGNQGGSGVPSPSVAFCMNCGTPYSYSYQKAILRSLTIKQSASIHYTAIVLFSVVLDKARGQHKAPLIPFYCASPGQVWPKIAESGLRQGGNTCQRTHDGLWTPAVFFGAEICIHQISALSDACQLACTVTRAFQRRNSFGGTGRQNRSQ